MTINNLKCIDSLSIELPLDKGLYAITGQNGSGKSTIVSCASSSFFNMKMKDYFGDTPENASILFELPTGKCDYKKYQKHKNGSKIFWKRNFQGDFHVRGFYEGSLIYGNRFRSTSLEKLRNLDRVNFDKLIKADEFIRTNLGYILHGNNNFYEKLWHYDELEAEFNGKIFFYEKRGKRVSQYHMSTGENLLISILNSLNKRINDLDNTENPCLILLDEIELALHPSSLKRLVNFMDKIAQEYNFAVYFSTHSLELIGSINPSNIFFLQRYADNSIEILNPCYPAYATRDLYDHDGYDKVILVEDELAKEIITRVLRREKLLTNKLVHVLPCGGFSNVITLGYEVIKDNLLSKKASISIVLDRDIEQKAKNFISKHNLSNSIRINFLPIQSLEKYLKSKLIENVDHTLFRELNDYLFQQTGLKKIIEDYQLTLHPNNDSDGKHLFKNIETELKFRNKSRNDLVEIIINYLSENGDLNNKELVEFLRNEL